MEIVGALTARDLFVVLLSEASLASPFCAFEIGYASALGKPLHLISLDGSLPPVFVQHLHAVDGLERGQVAAHTRVGQRAARVPGHEA